MDFEMSTEFELQSALTAYMWKYILMDHFMGISGANLGKLFVTEATAKWTLARMTAHVLN